jgi:branched-chain amino acid transport system substrate-binding protein
MKKLWIGILLLSFIVISIVLIDLESKKVSQKIYIGVIAPFSGDAAAYGQSAKRGVELAVDDLNYENKIKGKIIIPKFEDSKAQPSTGLNAFRKLVEVDKTPIVIGGMMSSVTLAIAPLANKTKTVIISPLSSNPKISNSGNYVFRIWPSDTLDGGYLAQFSYESLGIEKLAILHSTNDYGVGLKNVFQRKFKGNIAVIESFKQDSTDYRTQLTKIQGENPEAIFMAGQYKELARILIQAKELGIESQFLSTSMFKEQRLLEIAGKAANDVIYSTVAPKTEKETNVYNEFKEKFKKRFNRKPGIAAIQYYDATKLVAFSMKVGGFTGPEIREAMAQVNNYLGVNGQISFDKNGDLIKPITIETVRNGKFVTYEKKRNN